MSTNFCQHQRECLTPAPAPVVGSGPTITRCLDSRSRSEKSVRPSPSGCRTRAGFAARLVQPNAAVFSRQNCARVSQSGSARLAVFDCAKDHRQWHETDAAEDGRRSSHEHRAQESTWWSHRTGRCLWAKLSVESVLIIEYNKQDITHLHPEWTVGLRCCS